MTPHTRYFAAVLIALCAVLLILFWWPNAINESKLLATGTPILTRGPNQFTVRRADVERGGPCPLLFMLHGEKAVEIAGRTYQRIEQHDEGTLQVYEWFGPRQSYALVVLVLIDDERLAVKCVP